MIKQIAIYGAGGFAREVAWLAETCGHPVLCFVGDNPARGMFHVIPPHL